MTSTDNNPTADTPLDAARQHLDNVIAHLGMGESEANELRAYHEIQVRLDGNRLTYLGSDGFVRLDADRGYADLGTGPWVKAMEQEHPHLFPSKPKATIQTATATATSMPTTASDLMQAVRSGSLSPDEAISRLFDAHATAANPPTPTVSAMNVTQAMVAARRGEPHAIQYLNTLSGGRY